MLHVPSSLPYSRVCTVQYHIHRVCKGIGRHQPKSGMDFLRSLEYQRWYTNESACAPRPVRCKSSSLALGSVEGLRLRLPQAAVGDFTVAIVGPARLQARIEPRGSGLGARAASWHPRHFLEWGLEQLRNTVRQPQATCF